MSQVKQFGVMCALAAILTFVIAGVVSGAPRQLLQNGDFAQGLKHWNAQTGWSAQNGEARFDMENGNGIATASAALCSDTYAFGSVRRLRGTARLYENNPARGYVVPGVRWFDANRQRIGDYAFGYDHHARRKWVKVGFEADVPHGAKRAAFCFFGAAYAGETYRARADNATLE